MDNKPSHYVVTATNGNEIDIIHGAESLDILDQFKLWIGEMVFRVVSKHDFNIHILPDKIVFIKNQRHIPVPSLEEFTSRDNIIQVDHGEKWEEQGFATRGRIEFSGIYLAYLNQQT